MRSNNQSGKELSEEHRLLKATGDTQDLFETYDLANICIHGNTEALKILW